MGQKRIESTLSFGKLVHELHELRDQYERNSISKGDFRKKYYDKHGSLVFHEARIR